MTHNRGPIDELPRNAITQDAFLGYIIQKGIPTHFSVNNHGDNVEKDNRVVAILLLKVPSTDRFNSNRYYAFNFLGEGPTMGHALQNLYDQVEREVM